MTPDRLWTGTALSSDVRFYGSPLHSCSVGEDYFWRRKSENGWSELGQLAAFGAAHTMTGTSRNQQLADTPSDDRY